MNSSFPNRWLFSYLKFTKYVTNIIAEPRYKHVKQEQVTVRNHNRSTALERSVLKYWGLKPVLRDPTSPSASVMAQNIQLFGPCEGFLTHQWIITGNNKSQINTVMNQNEDSTETCCDRHLEILECRTTPLERWSKRPTVEPRWAKQKTKKLRPQPTKINSFMLGPSLSLTPDPPSCN